MAKAGESTKHCPTCRQDKSVDQFPSGKGRFKCISCADAQEMTCKTCGQVKPILDFPEGQHECTDCVYTRRQENWIRTCPRCKILKSGNGFDTHRRICRECAGVVEGAKVCSKCYLEKPIGQFYVSSRISTYGKRYLKIRSSCKSCEKPRAVTRGRKRRELPQPDAVTCSMCGLAKPSSDFPKGEVRCKECRSKWHSEHNQRPEIRNKQLKNRYGIEAYEPLFEKQGGKCAICGRKSDKHLYVDHNKETDIVRELLCENCNLGIGLFYESLGLLEKSIKYLRDSSMNPQDIQRVEPSVRFSIPFWKEQSRDRAYRNNKNTKLRHKTRGYGIDIDQYEYLLWQGNGVCWICSEPERIRNNKRSAYNSALAVDHERATGMIRGLLCSVCNQGIGHFEHNIEIIEGAKAYLDRHFRF